MATTAPGLEFQNWQNLPGIMETAQGGKSPLLKMLGLLMSGDSSTSESNATPEGAVNPSGYGITPPSMGAPSMGIKAPQFGLPPLPVTSLPTPNTQATPDYYHSQINSYWGQ